MDSFEELLESERICAEHYVRYRIGSGEDAEDVLQEVYLTAYQKFPQLKKRSAFRAWLISIAKNKCRDYFRKRAVLREVSLEELPERELADRDQTASAAGTVRETLDLLSRRDRQILYLSYWEELPHADIAKQLNIPLGTVKSRLHTAKRNFKAKYPYDTAETKGANSMKKLPERIPEYKIEASTEAPFAVKWEELMGWFLVPKLGEKINWGMYEFPSRRCIQTFHMEVTGKARVHGIDGVELTVREVPCEAGCPVTERTFVAQLTDTHCRFLAALRNDDDVRNYMTFLDGEEFLDNWGFGADNCGNETNLSPKGDISRQGSVVTAADKDFLLDIVGRYTVTIGGKSYDTVCVMDVDTYNCGVVSEQFLDRQGRTVLWRRFNRDDWEMDQYQKLWSEQLPHNERLTVNGAVYVHWFDCITDYIL